MEQANPTWRIPLADVDLGPEEEAAVLDVLRRGWLSMGEVTAAFEAEFAALTGARHALAVTNCTAALHLAGLALGWGPGDEVIVPSLTFVATANAVRYTGATPVFADITGESDFSLSAQDAAERITPRTKAIIVVHYAGHAADMGAILALAERHGLAVVEDVAHAPGADLDGRALGTWGNIGCFSFFANKNMTTGEGGMVTTDDDELAARLRLLRSHGMTSLTWDRHKGHAWSYDVVAPGYNYRIDEVRAAIGRVQLAKVTAANSSPRARRALSGTIAGRRAGIGRPLCRDTRDARLPSAAGAAAVGSRPPALHGRDEGARNPDQHPLSAHPPLQLLPGCGGRGDAAPDGSGGRARGDAAALSGADDGRRGERCSGRGRGARRGDGWRGATVS